MIKPIIIPTLSAFALVLGVASVPEARAQTVAAQQSIPALPPGAKPGECYAQVLTPAEYKDVTKTVVKREAGEKVETIPPEYEIVEENVLIKEASEKLEVIEAKYDVVEEQVLVKPASEKLEAVPAEYKTVEEQVLVREGYTTWKEGRGPIERVSNSTGKIMCLVNVPPEYKTVKKRVLVTPARTEKIEIPAEYKTIKKRVMVQPPQTTKIEIPAEYKAMKVKKLVKPAQEVRTKIPEEVETVTERQMVQQAKMEWRPILCETNTTPDVVRKLQNALQAAGYNPGGTDGALGPQTMAAVESYQQDKGLARGQLTLETLGSLGVLTSTN
jgi:hypothetical protein